MYELHTTSCEQHVNREASGILKVTMSYLHLIKTTKRQNGWKRLIIKIWIGHSFMGCCWIRRANRWLRIRDDNSYRWSKTLWLRFMPFRVIFDPCLWCEQSSINSTTAKWSKYVERRVITHIETRILVWWCKISFISIHYNDSCARRSLAIVHSQLIGRLLSNAKWTIERESTC